MTGRWKPLESLGLGCSTGPVDPYLWMAMRSGLVDYGAHSNGQIEVALEGCPDTLSPIKGLTVYGEPVANGFQTGRATCEALEQLLHTKGAVVRLAAPVVPQRAHKPWSSPATAGSTLQVQEETTDIGDKDHLKEPLIGLIDDGCPFAHTDLRRDDGGTRILRLWDQGSGATMRGLGTAPTQIAPYGRELTRKHLDAMMNDARGADGSVDEHACYLKAGYAAVLQRRSHGAHALGMLAGRRLWRTQAGPGKSGSVDLKDRPSSNADIVFVQLPHELVRCVGTGALEARAFDAMRYILHVGISSGYKRVVVSFGYESWVGPHDGSDWFCRAVHALVDDAKRQGVTVEVHMPAGNGRDQQAHIGEKGPRKSVTWDLVVPPDSEAPTFVEVWLNNIDDCFSVELTSPYGTELGPVQRGQAMAWPCVKHPQAMLVMPPVGRGPAMALLRIGPTRVEGSLQRAAPAGRWHISVSAPSGKEVAGLHAYVGRSEETLGASPRARQSRFAGREPKQVQGDHDGTLNGHALGKGTKIAGAYFRQSFPYTRRLTEVLSSKPTGYSGRGPSRKSGYRAEVDHLVAVEDGIFHPGMLAMGNRSGTVFRMQGTSVAAPWSARESVDSPGTTEQGLRHIDPYEPGNSGPAAPPNTSIGSK